MPVLDSTNTDNDSEMKQEEEEWKLDRMAKVHDIAELWLGSHKRPDTQMESRVHNKQMTAVGYISDTEEVFKALWSLFQYEDVTAFKLSERSPLPPPLSAKDLLEDELKF